MTKKIKILLLTHKDSDNIGDQFIQLCDLALLPMLLKNLGISENDYEIIDEKAAIIPPKYFQDKDTSLLKNAEQLISSCDLVMLGGAPQFNYLYQYFSERSVQFIKLCDKYSKPIIFSSIGVENYDADNIKCQRLKKALESDCVKMVTTRDGYDELTQFISKKNCLIAKVSDPAVWSGYIFDRFLSVKPTNKIGIFIMRSGAFTDNNLSFSDEDATKFWLDLIREIELRGYDYELITSGHFSDEAFMDHLVRDCGVKLSKCYFNMHKPEQLIERISSYKGVISCRLHPSILAYSLKVPSVGIEWNPKVKGFYDSIGYGGRTVSTNNLSADSVMNVLECAVQEGVKQNADYICSGYKYLFFVLQQLFANDNNGVMYDFDRIATHLNRFQGTPAIECDNKIKRKERRCYNNYNKLKEKNKKLSIKYNYRLNPLIIKYVADDICNVSGIADDSEFSVLYDSKKIFVINSKSKFHNNGHDICLDNYFVREGFTFAGWSISFYSGGIWFLLLSDGTLKSKNNHTDDPINDLYIVHEKEAIPSIQFKYIERIHMNSCWVKDN